MCTNNKIHIKFLCIGGEIIWRTNVSFLCYATQISIICTCINMKQLETD